MKFSYRVTAVSILVGTLIVVYFSWGDDFITWNQSTVADNKGTAKMEITNRPTPDTPSEHKQRLPPDKGAWEPQETFYGSTCDFTNNSIVNADIQTFDILTQLNKKEEYDITKKSGKVSSYKKPPLKIILVPHSHNDPGWHKTVDGYFEDQTRHTLNNMVEKLLKFRNMTFIWAETVFLSMWWDELDLQQKGAVKTLIERGQLEIVVGSWVVPDEANPNYYALIDQMIEGHQWLEKNLDVKPTNTWSLDPFGYSSTLAYLYKKAGFKNMVILRTHERVKEIMQKSKALEFYWRQHWDRQGNNDIFTLMMPYKLYNIKHTCGPDHDICLMFDFRKIPGEISESRAVTIHSRNVETQAKLLLGQYQKKADLFRHNVVLIPLGDDFRYDRPIEWDQQYKNYMMLFNYMNRKKEWNVEAKFGTLKDYFVEVENAAQLSGKKMEDFFPSMAGDFYPYTDQLSQFWAGYFTTRAFDKNLGREVEHHLKVAETLNVLAAMHALTSKRPFTLLEQNERNLRNARTSLGLFQHHDAITGTARNFVVMDYEDRLHSGLKSTENVIENAVKYLMGEYVSKKFILDIGQPKSLKMLTPTKKVIDIPQIDHGVDIILFNPTGQAREEIIAVTVNAQYVEVRDENNKLVVSQLSPIWLDESQMSGNEFELAFIARFPPLGLVNYNLKRVKHEKPEKNYAAYIRMYNTSPAKLSGLRFHVRPPPSGENIILENKFYRARFSTRNGYLQSITTIQDSKNTKAGIKMLMYKSRNSGAYIFGPAGPAVDSEFPSNPAVRVIKGPLYSEVQVVHTMVNHSVRLYNTSGILGKALEINNVVDMRDHDDKELIMRIETDIQNSNSSFYTDLNGFHIMRRQRFDNFPPEANYFPMTSMIYIEDLSARMSILSTQPLGASSQEDGSMEVMLDRRLRWDDNRGLGEGVTDNKRTPSRFYLLLERMDMTEGKPSPPTKSGGVSFPTLLSHILVNNLRNYPLITVSMTTNNDTSKKYVPLRRSLPCDVQLAHIRSLTSPGNQHNTALTLHRLGYHCAFSNLHIPCKVGEGSVLLKDLFIHGKASSIRESSLSLMHEGHVLEDGNAILNQMELHTYKITFE